MEIKKTKNTVNRLYEIAFESIIANLNENVGNERVDYFLEHFCNLFTIDYTSISILKNMYLKKMRPNKREKVLYATATHTPFAKTRIDYRTIKKYRDEWELLGGAEMQPCVINEYLRPVIKLFVDKYLSLMFDNLWNISYIKGIEMDE